MSHTPPHTPDPPRSSRGDERERPVASANPGGEREVDPIVAAFVAEARTHYRPAPANPEAFDQGIRQKIVRRRVQEVGAGLAALALALVVSWAIGTPLPPRSAAAPDAAPLARATEPRVAERRAEAEASAPATTVRADAPQRTPRDPALRDPVDPAPARRARALSPPPPEDRWAASLAYHHSDDAWPLAYHGVSELYRASPDGSRRVRQRPARTP